MHRHTIHGLELAFVDRGTGPAVLLVHGFPLDHTMWNAQIEALSQSYRVIAPDLRGFGASGVSQDTVTMRQMADDLAALLDAREVSGRVALCGLSMGGYIAFQFQRAYGNRLRALVLCDTRSMPDTPEAAAGRHQTADRLLAEGRTSFLADAMLPKLLSPATLRDRPAIAETLRRTIEGNDPRGVAAAARGMAQRPDATPWLSEIACPTLVVVGAEDAISSPAEMQGIARGIPKARCVEIAGAGHMSPVEAPQAVNAALLQFLGEIA